MRQLGQVSSLTLRLSAAGACHPKLTPRPSPPWRRAATLSLPSSPRHAGQGPPCFSFRLSLTNATGHVRNPSRQVRSAPLRLPRRKSRSACPPACPACLFLLLCWSHHRMCRLLLVVLATTAKIIDLRRCSLWLSSLPWQFWPLVSSPLSCIDAAKRVLTGSAHIAVQSSISWKASRQLRRSRMRQR